MHELSIALSLVDGVQEEAAARGGLRVLAVHIKLGPRSGVNFDALAFAYSLACDGTPLAGSRLVADSATADQLEVSALEVAP